MRSIFVAIPLTVFAFSLLIISVSPVLAAEPGHHALVRFWFDTPSDQVYLAENHLRFVIEGRPTEEYVDLVVRPEEVAELQREGSRVEVLHEDVENFWASRLEGRDTWGLYHTYSEAFALVDSLHQNYPQIVSARWSIGQGHLGNHIYAFRISDNPEVDEPDEPEILFDGMTHANEIMGGEACLMLAEYLVQQYLVGDPEIVALVNEREIYIVPIVSADGMIYNEQVYPNGGATWRKNRRDNLDGSFGVDINRNYDFEWGCSWGSSGTPSDPTYRGPAAESEPEIQAICAFIDAQDFVVRQSFHSSGNLTLYPWGYTEDPTPDADIFRELGAAMVQFNGYEAGQLGDPGVLYLVCGGSIDWDYGAQDRHTKIFGFTNELGTSQWPPTSQRQAIFDDNLWPALYLIQMAGELRGVSWQHTPAAFTAANGQPSALLAVPTGFEGTAIDAATVALHYRIDGGAYITVAMAPTGIPGEYGAEIPAQSEGTIVEYYLAASDVEGREGTSPRGAPDALHYFEVGTEFTHPMETDRGWIVGAADDDAGTGIWVRVDPVGTAAQPEDDHTVEGTDCWVTGQHIAGETVGFNDVDGGKTTLLSPIYDLTGAETVSFSYWRWYSNDQGNNPSEDTWQVDLSNDGGQTWTELELTQTSSNAWESHSFEVGDYFAAPGRVQLRFVASDEINGSIVEAAVDDFQIAGVFEVIGTGDVPPGYRLGLAQNYPNPFNPQTTIRFQVPAAGKVQLGVYDVTGRLVRMLLDETVNAGNHALTWNGRDALGRPAASGVYHARLFTEDGVLSRRMVLLK